jgi:hypothetical protein
MTTPALIGTEVTPEVAGRITACRNHLGLVEAHWGPRVSGHCAMSLVNSLSALFGIARDGGTIGTAGSLGLWANRFIYCEMVPFELNPRQIANLMGDGYDADDIDKLLSEPHTFVRPVEWSVHS